MKKGCLVSLGIFLFLVFMSVMFADEEETVSVENNEEVKTVKKTKDLKKWNEISYIDEMTDTETVRKSLTSDNEHEFEFPYNGGSSLTINVRNMKNSTDVYLSLDNGQIIGNEFDGSNYVNIRFDDNKPQKFYFVGSADYSTDVVFLKKAKTFIDNAKTAKTIRIELPVFQEGRPLYTFTVDVPLEWNN